MKRSYIHEYAPHDQFMYENYYLSLESKDILNELISMENKIQEKIYFGESVDNELFVLEAEKKNIFERIGDTIIEIFKSFIDLFKSTGNAIKDAITNTRKNTTSDKFKDAMKRDPALAEDFLRGVMSGNIKANDVKNLNELLDEATKITNNLIDGNINKKTFNEKIDKALDKAGNTARNIGSILGIVASALGIYVTAQNLKDRKEDRAEAIKDREQARLDRAEARKDREQARLDREREKINREEDRIEAKMDRIQARKDSANKRVADELKFKNDLMNSKLSATQANKYNKAYRSVFDNAFDIMDGDYVSEAVSLGDTIKKIMNFFSEHLSFCTSAIDKLSSLKDKLTKKLKEAKDSEEGSVITTAISGLQKVMGYISKELNTVKNLAVKAEKQTA